VERSQAFAICWPVPGAAACTRRASIAGLDFSWLEVEEKVGWGVSMGTNIRPRLRRIVTLGVVGAVIVTAAGCIAPPPPPPPTVIVYGDSLTFQSASYINAVIEQQRPGWRVIDRDLGGTALCDWLPAMAADSGLNARVVVIQFSGNAFTPCMTGFSIGTQPWIAKYKADAETAAALWMARGVKLLFVGNPLGVCSVVPHPLDAGYRDVAATFAATFSDAPEQSLAVDSGTLGSSGQPVSSSGPPGTQGAVTAEPQVQAASAWPCSPPPNPGSRVFAFEMPCLPSDTANGVCGQDVPNFARVRDGTPNMPGGHFCTAVPGPDPCPDYSSGVFRFGGAIASAAIALMT
jgi:hypothetical protein